MGVENRDRRRAYLFGGVDPLQLVPAREFDRLALVLTHAERGAWVFCLYNTAAVRDAIVEALEARLAPLPLYEFTLSPQCPNPRDYLRTLPAGAAERQAVIVFYDAWRAFDHGFFGYLDLQREQFMKFPHSLVFWVREADRAVIARYAPNFFSRHAGMFNLQVTIPEQAQALRGLQTIIGPVSWDSVAERERQERLYGGLLAEYEADVEPDRAAIADLLSKLATIWYYSNRYEEAEAVLRWRFNLVCELGDQTGQADSLYKLGLIAAFRYQLDQALESYAKALRLFRAVGDRLGEANVFLALGRLAHNQGDLRAARARAQDALAVYRTMDNAWNTALALWDLGQVERDDGNQSAACACYQEALTLLEHIGAPAAAELREEMHALGCSGDN